MPTKSSVRVVRTKHSPKVEMRVSFAFDANDPKAEVIYRGIGLLLCELLSPEEAQEFMRKLSVEQAKVKAG